MSNRRRKTVRIDYDRLADAIVKAELQVDDEIEHKREKEKEELQKDWEANLGINKEKPDYINDLRVLMSIVFMKKEKAIALAANNALLKMVLAGLYKLFEIVLYCIDIIALVFSVVLFVQKAFEFGFFTIAIIFFLFLIARVIRIARFEIDNITDKNYLATLFAAIMSFVALIVSAIAIVISIIYKG